MKFIETTFIKTMDSNEQAKNDTFGTLLMVGAGALVAWKVLTSDTAARCIYKLDQWAKELAAAERRRVELEVRQRLRQVLAEYSQKLQSTPNTMPPSPSLPSPTPGKDAITPSVATYTNKVYLEPDSIWRKKIVHPSTILILGKRGSGKSALAYRILELFHFGPKPYVIGVPASKRHLLPDWVGIATSLEEVPIGAIVIVDEAYLHFHARGSNAEESKEMSKLVNLSRQNDLTIIFVSQEARQIDKNIVSSSNVIIFKDLGILQLQFDRPELNKLAAKAKEAFASVTGDKRRWSYLYAPDTNSWELIENELPSFWKPGLSRMFAGQIRETSKPSKPRKALKLTLEEKIRKAKELRGRELLNRKSQAFWV